MTTVLDRDSRTVSTRLPLFSRRNAQLAAEPGDARLAAEADQVQTGDPGLREGVPRRLEADLEALLLGVGRGLAALDQPGRNGDPWHLLVDEAQGGGPAHEQDRRDDRCLRDEAMAPRQGHEAVEPLGLEADLELDELRARAHLRQRALDALLVRRRARV